MPKTKKTVIEKPKKKKIKKIKKKKEIKKPPKVKTEKKPLEKKERYLEAIGRRKTAIARVRLFTKGEKLFLVNKKLHNVYFPTLELQQVSQSALEKMKLLDRFRILAKVKGGGFHAQAEALRHALTRVLVKFNPDFRKRLKKAGYMKRDPRMRERKKFGLKRARKAPQWQKR